MASQPAAMQLPSLLMVTLHTLPVWFADESIAEKMSWVLCMCVCMCVCERHACVQEAYACVHMCAWVYLPLHRHVEDRDRCWCFGVFSVTLCLTY